MFDVAVSGRIEAAWAVPVPSPLMSQPLAAAQAAAPPPMATTATPAMTAERLVFLRITCSSRNGEIVVAGPQWRSGAAIKMTDSEPARDRASVCPIRNAGSAQYRRLVDPERLT